MGERSYDSGEWANPTRTRREGGKCTLRASDWCGGLDDDDDVVVVDDDEDGGGGDGSGGG